MHVLALVLQTLSLLLVGSRIFGLGVGLLVVGWGLANNFSSSPNIFALFLSRVLVKVSFVVRFYSRMVLTGLDMVRARLDIFLLQRFLVGENASLVFETLLDEVALTNICLYYQIEVSIVGQWFNRVRLAEKPWVVSKCKTLTGVVNSYAVICNALSKLVVQLGLAQLQVKMLFGDRDTEYLLLQLVLIAHNFFTGHSFRCVTLKTSVDKLNERVVVEF